MLGQTLEN
jgi:hypothetical protein